MRARATGRASGVRSPRRVRAGGSPPTKGLADKQTKHSELPRSGETEREQLEREITEIKAELKTRMDDVKKTVTIRDLDQALSRALNASVCTKKQLEYMIWEVDENLDGCVDWDEFQMMYYRNMTDTTGLEPFELFNIVQRAAYSPAPFLRQKRPASVSARGCATPRTVHDV